MQAIWPTRQRPEMLDEAGHHEGLLPLLIWLLQMKSTLMEHLQGLFGLLIIRLRTAAQEHAALWLNLQRFTADVVIKTLLERLNHRLHRNKQTFRLHLRVERLSRNAGADHIWTDCVQRNSFSQQMLAVAANEPNDAAEKGQSIDSKGVSQVAYCLAAV